MKIYTVTKIDGNQTTVQPYAAQHRARTRQKELDAQGEITTYDETDLPLNKLGLLAAIEYGAGLAVAYQGPAKGYGAAPPPPEEEEGWSLSELLDDSSKVDPGADADIEADDLGDLLS